MPPNIAVTEQPPPVKGKGDIVFPVALKHFIARIESAKEHYKTYLETENDRDPLADDLQEAIDQVMYTTQAIMERDKVVELMRPLFNFIMSLRDSKSPKDHSPIAAQVPREYLDKFVEAYRILAHFRLKE